MDRKWIRRTQGRGAILPFPAVALVTRGCNRQTAINFGSPASQISVMAGGIATLAAAAEGFIQAGFMQGSALAHGMISGGTFLVLCRKYTIAASPEDHQYAYHPYPPELLHMLV